MLAVKLHKKKKPWLGKGSYLVPISNWSAGKSHVSFWINTLNYTNRGRPNDAIRYITLVKIPNEHPVFIAHEAYIKRYVKVEFKPLNEIDDKIKQSLDLAKLKHKGAVDTGYSIIENVNPGGLIADLPEMILGEALPSSCIKWTKDLKLLYKKRY